MAQRRGGVKWSQGVLENRKWLRRWVSPAGPAGEVGGEGLWRCSSHTEGTPNPSPGQGTPKGSAGKSMVRLVL